MSKKYKPSGSNKTDALTKDQFDYIIEELSDRDAKRDVIICLIMFQCCRINDVLQQLKIKDVYKPDGTVKESILFEQQKSGRTDQFTGKKIRKGKTKEVIAPQGSMLHKLLSEYSKTLRGRNFDDVMFYSHKRKTPFTDEGFNKILRGFVGKRNIEQCSSHSIRKCGAKFLHFDKGVSIEIISKILDHESTKVTMVYLDIKPKEVRECMSHLAI